MTDLNLPQPNIPLLRKAVEWAEAEAAKEGGSLWYQALYTSELDCGTAYCIAGYAVSLQPGFEGGNGFTARVDGQNEFWDDIAIRALGITGDEAEELFFFDNTITRVREVAEQIAARAGERL